MAQKDQNAVNFRIVIDQPVIGVLHSLQAKDDSSLDPKCSRDGEALLFDFQIRIGPGPKFFGDQVRREGPVRRFVYVRVGQSAGDPSSPWSRRMKIDIHDIENDLLDRAAKSGGIIETTVIGTDKDGSPACATVRPTGRRFVERGRRRLHGSQAEIRLEHHLIVRLLAHRATFRSNLFATSPKPASSSPVLHRQER